MGWHKPSSGNRYASFSEHALMIGCPSKNIVAATVSSKMCQICSLSEENGEEPPDHVWPNNYDGSSKAMEVDAALHLYKSIYELLNKNLYLKVIVVDDDSLMRVLLKHRLYIQKEDCL